MLELRDFVPPVVLKGKRWLKNRARSTAAGVQSASYYDGVYGESEQYLRHYADSVYYASWTVLVDRMRRAQVRRVLDIGCGPGQFAALLKDHGFTDYQGLDFSARAIEMAGARVPSFRFTRADALTSELITGEYDIVISLEFLEHVEPDLEILARVRPGTHVLATVPNFPSHSHVRHFTSAGSVAERYGKVLDGLEVDEVQLNGRGTALYLLEGRRRT